MTSRKFDLETARRVAEQYLGKAKPRTPRGEVEDLDWTREPMPAPPKWWIARVNEFYAEQNRIENLDDYDSPIVGEPFEEPQWLDEYLDIGKLDLYTEDDDSLEI